MSKENNIEDTWEILRQVNEWLRFADAKAAAILTASGVLFGFVVDSLPAWDHRGQNPWQYWLTLTSLVALGAAGAWAIGVLAPRLGKEKPSSLIYFDHIARGSETANSYLKRLKQATNTSEELFEELGSQIWCNSKVARKKYKGITRATRLFGLALLLAGSGALIGRLV